MKITEIERKSAGVDIEFDERDKTLKDAKPVPGDDRFVYIIEKSAAIEKGYWGGGTDFRVYFYDKSTANEEGAALIAWMGFRGIKIAGLDNSIQVSNVVLDTRYRGQGVGILMYTTLLQAGYVIFSDESQTPQARKLWVKLNQTPGVQVNGIIKIMRKNFDLESAGPYFQQEAQVNQKKLQSLGTKPLVNYSKYGRYDWVPFTFPVKSLDGGKELGAPGIKLYHDNDTEKEDFLYLYAQWVG
jgi:hypothetical protein